MKKLFVLALSFLSMNIYAQKIFKSCDDMTNECIYFSDSDLILANEKKTKGFTLSPSIDEKDGQIYMSGLIASMVNIGACCEKNVLIVMFADSTKLSFTSWNKFNCEGNAYFHMNSSDAEMFFSKPIIKLKIENGYTHDEFSCSVKDPSRKYFLLIGEKVKSNAWVKYEE